MTNINPNNVFRLEAQLSDCQNALVEAIRNYKHALHFQTEYVKPYTEAQLAKDDFYKDYVFYEVCFWADDIEFWQDTIHKLHRLIEKYAVK